ncbi:hypothetical protein HE1_00774 [Holospora elegans E1]|uniref:Uncharacterized protein n=1 Tax=Holospora elegans E1 TaxID=1427503 RepID=A0A023DZJ4_9PROT|nr:hypothetical protein [Holospora elegans]GAJ46440.1 hypothetical protein HE1_00774 [Holospora elegans E1]
MIASIQNQAIDFLKPGTSLQLYKGKIDSSDAPILSDIENENGFTEQQKITIEVYNAVKNIVFQKNISKDEKIEKILDFAKTTSYLSLLNKNNIKRKISLFLHPDKSKDLFSEEIIEKISEVFKEFHKLFPTHSTNDSTKVSSESDKTTLPLTFLKEL